MALVMFYDIIKMNPIPIITAIPNIHTDSYKKQWSLGLGLTLEMSGSSGI